MQVQVQERVAIPEKMLPTEESGRKEVKMKKVNRNRKKMDNHPISS